MFNDYKRITPSCFSLARHVLHHIYVVFTQVHASTTYTPSSSHDQVWTYLNTDGGGKELR